MTEIFTRKQANDFYGVIYNELNSVLDTENNSSELLRCLGIDVSSSEEPDKLVKSSIDFLLTVRKISFCGSAYVEDKEALKKDIEVLFEYDFPMGLDGFANEIINFVTSDIFSQNSPMNQISETCYNLLNSLEEIDVEPEP